MVFVKHLRLGFEFLIVSGALGDDMLSPHSSFHQLIREGLSGSLGREVRSFFKKAIHPLHLRAPLYLRNPMDPQG
jgi:hypothetical protein